MGLPCGRGPQPVPPLHLGRLPPWHRANQKNEDDLGRGGGVGFKPELGSYLLWAGQKRGCPVLSAGATPLFPLPPGIPSSRTQRKAKANWAERGALRPLSLPVAAQGGPHCDQERSLAAVFLVAQACGDLWLSPRGRALPGVSWGCAAPGQLLAASPGAILRPEDFFFTSLDSEKKGDGEGEGFPPFLGLKGFVLR